MNLIWFILIGLLAGFLAAIIMRGKGLGFFSNLLIGVIGGILGGTVFDLLDIATKSFISNLIGAIIGAVVLILIPTLILKRS